MNRGYLIGVGLGLLLIVAGWSAAPWFIAPPPIEVTFAPATLDEANPPVSHGHQIEVLMELINRGRGRVRLDAIQCREPFVRPAARFKLPATITPGTTVRIPFEIVGESPRLGRHEVQVTAVVSNGRTSQEVQWWLVCEVAAHINPEPLLVQFSRVNRKDTIPPKTLRLWYVEGDPPPEEITVTSVDPAVTVTAKPMQLIQNGKHYVMEIGVEIDARLAQAQHRSQIVVRTKGDHPPVIIPVAGYVDE